MRVLLIDVNYKSGSTGKIVDELYKKIIENGNEAAVAYGRGVKIKGQNIYKFGIEMETKFHVLMNRITGIHGSFSPLSTLRLKRFIKHFKPDVIHIHELHGYFVNIVSIIKFIKKLNIRIIWTFHSEFMYEAKGHVYSEYEFSNWKIKKEYPKSWFIDGSKYSVKRYSKVFENYNNLTITTPSYWLTNRTKKSGLFNCDILTIHNSFDDKVFFPNAEEGIYTKYGIDKNKNIILAIAPNIMDSRKGGHYFLDLAKNDLSNANLYVMVGINKKDKLPNMSNIVYIERTENQNDLAKLYTLANVTVLLSRRETFSMVALESLACGTPVVGFKAGAPETIFVEPYGYFSEYGNLDLLKKNIDKVISKEKNTIKNSNFANKHFNNDVIFQKFLEYYKDN